MLIRRPKRKIYHTEITIRHLSPVQWTSVAGRENDSHPKRKWVRDNCTVWWLLTKTTSRLLQETIKWHHEGESFSTQFHMGMVGWYKKHRHSWTLDILRVRYKVRTRETPIVKFLLLVSQQATWRENHSRRWEDGRWTSKIKKIFTCTASLPAWADKPAWRTCQIWFQLLLCSGSATTPRRSCRRHRGRRAAGTSRASGSRSPEIKLLFIFTCGVAAISFVGHWANTSVTRAWREIKAMTWVVHLLVLRTPPFFPHVVDRALSLSLSVSCLTLSEAHQSICMDFKGRHENCRSLYTDY